MSECIIDPPRRLGSPMLAATGGPIDHETETLRIGYHSSFGLESYRATRAENMHAAIFAHSSHGPRHPRAVMSADMVDRKRESPTQCCGCWWAPFLAILVALSVFIPKTASARLNGIASEGCSGCHNGGAEPKVTISVDAPMVSPGQAVTLTVTIENKNGPVAGFFLLSNNKGTFRIIDSGTKVNVPGVSHTAPRAGVDGMTTFTVGWTAPAEPGGVDFNVYVISANDDRTPRGDGEGSGFLSFAVGCGAGTKYYRDFDGDGYGGITSGYAIDCAVRQGYATQAMDCDDNNEKINPGMTEICDNVDNNCDGNIDEGLSTTTFCQDDDGDGHGILSGTRAIGCGQKGFGLCDGDCNDKDAKIFPGAVEVCNNRDDDCDGRIDDGARPTCGLGWCRRSADSCTSTVCIPGKPKAEECNLFDDDCDGVDDNGTDLELCGQPGLLCRAGKCIADPNGGTLSDDAGVGSGGAAGSTGAPADGAAGTPAEEVDGSSTRGAAGSASSVPGDDAGGCRVAFAGRPAAGTMGWLGTLIALATGLRRRSRGRPRRSQDGCGSIRTRREV